MLFCLTADYTPQALNAMRENPNTNRQAAVEQLLSAAGGKLVAMYGRATNGPGVMVIFDVTLQWHLLYPVLLYPLVPFITSN